MRSTGPASQIHLDSAFWGKSHMKLGGGAQFVRFSVTSTVETFALKKMEAGEKGT